MDHELLIALCVLWLSSTWCLFAAAFMWIYNEGEAFHPHAVDMEQRHQMFEVVGSKTKCKNDFAVKSVSEFIAPRGSTSDKHFTVFLIMGGVAGFLGTLRWQAVGDATSLEATLAQIGFFCLIIVAMFEVDVSSLVFLEEKLVITTWLLEMLKIQEYINFPLSQYSPELLELIRCSPDLHSLYEEDDGKLTIQPVFLNFKFSMHVVGATGFAIFITASIILNDLNEEKVAWITGCSFIAFASVGYLTGSYVPVFSIFKGWILLWNPFVREPNFLIKLQEAVNIYNQKHGYAGTHDISTKSSKQESVQPSAKRKKVKSHPARSSKSTSLILSSSKMHSNAKMLFSSNPLISIAHQFPKLYLRVLSHVIMTIELVSLLTPMIAMGIQWITSLCHSTPPVIALLSMFGSIVQCVLTKDYDCPALEESCIMAKSM